MRKGWIIAIGAAFAVFALAYGASPYLAVRGFVAAAKQGDAEKLRGSVDFPAVRADLKPQLTAAVTTRMERDPQIRGNPFAGLGAILMPERGLPSRLSESGTTVAGRGNSKAKENTCGWISTIPANAAHSPSS